MSVDLKTIKKRYGEEMAHLCRELFPTILEKPGLLSMLLSNYFEPSHFLYNDIINNNLEGHFKNFIYSFFEFDSVNEISNVTKSPSELFNDVGYDLYECHTEEEIQKFKKYYKKEEELCTFKGGRLTNYHVFFAIKKNVEDIKREDFKNPKRQDKYGTSVLCLQFTKDSSHTLSIKNRYNHTVINADSTFSNNLDNINLGLTKSFSKYYNLTQRKIDTNLEIPNYVRDINGKYHYYNLKIDNNYYCANNIIIRNFKVEKYNPDRYLLFENFCLDLLEKKLYNFTKYKDGLEILCSNITKIDIRVNGNIKNVLIYDKYSGLNEIGLDCKNNIVYFKNEQIEYIPENFLYYNKKLKSIILPNVLKIMDNFLFYNESLLEIDLSKTKYIGSYFMINNSILNYINISNVEKIGDYFLFKNLALTYIDLSNVKYIGESFMSENVILKRIIILNAQFIGDFFLYKNNNIDKNNILYIIRCNNIKKLNKVKCYN